MALLATQSTLSSNLYQNLIRAQSPAIKVFPIPCPLFAPLVEEGLHQHPLAEQLAAFYLRPLQKEPIDVALLACTHYHHLKGAIEKALQRPVLILDPAQQCAENIKRELEEQNLICRDGGSGQREFFVTDNPERFLALAVKFPGFPQEHVNIRGYQPFSKSKG